MVKEARQCLQVFLTYFHDCLFCIYRLFSDQNGKEETPLKPFLKWAGGKYKLVPHIKELLPKTRRLIEPFVGSGAVFLNIEYDEYLLGDINRDLINLYKTLQEKGPAFIQFCKSFFTPEHNSEEMYYILRERFNSEQDITVKSALFVYLNRHGYNGLCRYNTSGKFNVPFGRYKKPYFPEAEMHYFYEKAKRATFVCAGFTDTMYTAQEGDVIYCDPPYVPLSETALFTTYSAGGFGKEQQLELARIARELADRNIPVLISNHETDFTLKAYASAQIRTLEVQRNISCDRNNRNKAKEVLALF
ncbi:DNA adenine methylase Dam [Aneurinibacillus thermoaerophilus]|uniref:Site-specific DNA-methyltransferase (adenine-specific) n=1 Tax=Aneurinibacillus thermoaerophilus TaxID=143495 RepID=A0A1G7YEP9_ANETH|nr:Dam family site-specific DNA-(adenine-N6)-methyltransferase [Aneurinibacillus thermoaerophilus]SDG94883.1 DNA adenine methylase Dam [Aneurinibacillus thermoaerophilus]